MREQPAFADGQGLFYQARRDRFTELLKGSRFVLRPVHGTYFQLADYSAVSDLPDTAFCEMLTRSHGVAAIPLSPFCDQSQSVRLVRFCFAKHDATLEAAAEKLRAVARVFE